MTNPGVSLNKNTRIYFSDAVEKLSKELDLDPVSRRYLLARTRTEGLIFLSKTLPTLSKAVLRSLEIGHFERPTGFRWKGTSLEFCSVWLSGIFARNGDVLSSPDPECIFKVRQLCEYFYKFTLEFSKKEEANAEQRFLDIEDRLCSPLNRDHAEGVRKVAERLFPELLHTPVHAVFKHTTPRFGPGSFSGSRELRHHFSVWKHFPSERIGTTSSTYRAFSGLFSPYRRKSRKLPMDSRVRGIRDNVTLKEEPKISEMCIVPKDARGPRIISKEPPLLLMGQMSYFGWLSKSLTRLSKGRINFSDQGVNRQLARKGSIDKSLATLDLKDASDMVRTDFCRLVFRNFPAIRWFINNARSEHIRLPSGRLHRLRKLSGMGSGMTFPTMALIIHCTIVYGVHHATKLPIEMIGRDVYVYGDDVIVPTEWASIAASALADSHLIVNTEKSYHRSHFRESCGGDYFAGTDVCPVRIKLTNGQIRKTRKGPMHSFTLHTEGAVLQLERHCCELVACGFYKLANFYYRLIEKCLGSILPLKAEGSAVLGRTNPGAYFPPQGEEVEVIVPRAVFHFSQRSCPLKHLYAFFERNDGKQAEDYMFVRSAPLGLIARPRSVRLEKTVLPLTALVAVD